MASKRPRAKEPSWDGFDWKVVSARRAANLGSAKPRATVILDRSAGDESPAASVKVPAAVGKRLVAERDDIGCSPSREELLEHIASEQETCCRERAERLVMQRDYSEKELGDRLRRDGYPADCVDALVGRFSDVGVVDDARFASVYIRSKVAQGWGRLRIARELENRGIRVEDVEGWPDEFFEDDERTRALEIASRRSLAKRLSAQGTARFLVSRGFSQGVAIGVARELEREAKQEQAASEGDDEE